MKALNVVRVDWEEFTTRLSSALSELRAKCYDLTLGPIEISFDRTSAEQILDVNGSLFTAYACVKKVGRRRSPTPALLSGIMLVGWPDEYNHLFANTSEASRFVWGANNPELYIQNLLM